MSLSGYHMYTEGKGPYRGANSYVTRQGFEASYAGREVGCWGTAAISSHESGGVLRAVETPEVPNYVNDMAADEKAKGPTGVPTVMSLGKASKPATLDERLVAGALRPSVVTKVVACYEP